jgi:hypothetical protein
VKSVRDPSAGDAQDGGLCLDRPVAAESPLIQPQMRWEPIGLRRVPRRATRRREVRRFAVADVRLRRFQAGLVGLDFDTMRVDDRGRAVDSVAGIRQQLANLRFQCSYLPSPK